MKWQPAKSAISANTKYLKSLNNKSLSLQVFVVMKLMRRK